MVCFLGSPGKDMLSEPHPEGHTSVVCSLAMVWMGGLRLPLWQVGGGASTRSEQGGVDIGETARTACQADGSPVGLGPAVSGHLSSLKCPVPVHWGCFSS